MTDHDELLTEVGAALQVEPSAAFAPSVRARVDALRRRSRWMWFSIAAACASVAVVVLWRPSTGPVMVKSEPKTVVAAHVVVTPPSAPAPEPSSAPRQAQPSRRPAIASPVATTATAFVEPRLEVITNQPALLRELWHGRVSGAVVAAADTTAATSSELIVKPIEVEPIVVPLIVVNEFVIRR